MKKSTMEAKLNALFGIPDPSTHAKAVKSKNGVVVGLTEDEIQDTREVQGVHYFFIAPHLFDAKICKHCGSSFLVSRKYVAYCSYTCIEKSILEDYGVEWKHKGNYEAAYENRDVWNKNEPFWIRHPENLIKCLEKLQEAVSLGSPNG